MLILLFVTATTSEEELLLDPATVMHPPSMHHEVALEKPLFSDSVGQEKLVDDSPKLVSKTPQKKAELKKETATSKSSSQIVHKLPKIEGAKPAKKQIAQAKPVVKPQVKKEPVKRIESAVKTIKVKKGDTLERIARRHGSTVKQIVALNHLPSTFLRIGQVLKIPTGNKGKSNALKQISAAEGEYYTVKPGDNPWTIAMKHHMKVHDLLKLNHLDERKAKRLKPGDRLKIR